MTPAALYVSLIWLLFKTNTQTVDMNKCLYTSTDTRGMKILPESIVLTGVEILCADQS